MGSIDEKEVKALLEATLDGHREVLLRKVEGAAEEDRRKRLVPSATTLLGIVRHVAYAERWWFQDRFAGEIVDFPDTDVDPDAEFFIETESSDEIFELYRIECEKSRAIVKAAELGAVARHGFRGAPPRTLFWILVHMIEETARHNGHADILREQLDGTTGD